jgi:hypothetical protein
MFLRVRLSPFLGQRVSCALIVALAVVALARHANAAGESGGVAPAISSGQGLAVVAFPGATDVAWPLAEAVYGEPTLRPNGIGDATARVLCGEPAAAGSAVALVDLAAEVAALRGDDAPSRALLAEIARHAAVRGLVAVRVSEGHPFAQVFLAETGLFDAATFAPDEAPKVTPRVEWAAAVRSLARSYPAQAAAPVAAPRPAPALATRQTPPSAPSPPGSHPFYESAWFWGAVGAAVLAGGGVYLASRDTSPSTIHLELQVH